jgi:AbrB family looped-hinge helix DNA binding protein
MKAVVAERGQVTIPKRLRERLGIRPGTVLEFREDADRLVAEKAETAGALDR